MVLQHDDCFGALDPSISDSLRLVHHEKRLSPHFTLCFKVYVKVLTKTTQPVNFRNSMLIQDDTHDEMIDQVYCQVYNWCV